MTVPEEPTVEDLDALSTDHLRQRAFSLAERRVDVKFFWGLVRHLPAAGGVATEDGSAGEIAGGFSETIELVRELVTGDVGDAEPLLRAAYIDYVKRHS